MARTKQSARKSPGAPITNTKRSRDSPSSSTDDDVPTSKRAAVWDEAAFANLIALPHPTDEHACQVSVRKGQRCDSSQLKEGAVLYRYARIVVLNTSDNTTRVRNQDLHAEGESADWNLDTNLIDQQCWSPDQFTKVVPVTMTEMASKIKDEVGDCVCKVEFTKLPDASAMADMLQRGSAMIEASGLSAAEKKKLYKQLHARTMQGDYRIMRGYLLRSEGQHMLETDTGMVRFIDADLMAQGKHCERQVNVRTVRALTFKLTKYVLK